MKDITVIDSIMGSGKTTFLIDYINNTHSNELGINFNCNALKTTKFLVVVPLLSEVDRITNACSDLRFKNPQAINGKKLFHLLELIERGENIVTTHALFKLIDRDIYKAIKNENYTLILDEALDCVDIFDQITTNDRKLIFDSNMVYVDKLTSRLCWNHEDYDRYKGKFLDIKRLCDIGSIIAANDKVFIWEFPHEFLMCFNKIIVSTYQFNGSLFYCYLKAKAFDVCWKTIRNGALYDMKGRIGDDDIRTHLSSLITIYKGQMNEIGNADGKCNPLSASWFDKASSKDIKRLKSSCETFFARVAKSPSKLNGWTTFVKVRPKIAGKGYTKGWISSNAKATNEYSNMGAMAYNINCFCHPLIKGYFNDLGIQVDEDAYALSSMIQWIWRSRIRRGEPIHVFIPSQRMRTLLERWLNPLNEQQL